LQSQHTYQCALGWFDLGNYVEAFVNELEYFPTTWASGGGAAMNYEEGNEFVDEVKAKYPNDIILLAQIQQLQAELKAAGNWNQAVIAKLKMHLGMREESES
jgi:hypothetical protein